MKRRRHPLAGTREYQTWQRIRSRCYCVTHPDYHLYGGRGIAVCARWRNSFDAFLSDMGLRPSERHSIERLDTDGNYEPSNCVWSTPKAQANNRRTNQTITLNGVTKTVAEWAETIGIGGPALYWRLHRGWDPQRILSKGPATLLTHNGQTRTVTAWARALGIKTGTIYYRLEHGWPVERVLG